MAASPQGQLPATFQRSCLNSTSYPCNIRYASRLPQVSLKAIKSRLDDVSHELFETNENFVDVPCQDLCLASAEEWDRQYIHSSDKLTTRLGLKVECQGNSGKRVVKAEHADPKCRFFYIYAETSRDCFKITKSMMAEILTFHQVMPHFVDMISVFGNQLERRDLVQFGSFRQQLTLNEQSQRLAIDALGRSGSQFQLSYLLASVILKSEDSKDFRFNDWSIRQAAIHHQFDVENGNALWIVTKGRMDVWDQIKESTKPDRETNAFQTLEGCLQSSLDTHMLFCQWSAEDWKGYVRWLEMKVDAESSMTVLGPSGENHAHKQYKPQDIQDLQRLEDKANEITTTLEANVSVLKALRRFYKSLKDNENFPHAEKCAGHIAQFSVDVDDIVCDFEMQTSRTKALAKLISDRKVMALQHMQSQAAERVQTLNQHMEKEAIVMRIITVVTLFYLPPTFVSTFFSAGVVQYQDQNGNDISDGSLSVVGMCRWLSVALPLTFLTLLAAFLGRKWTERVRHPNSRLKRPLTEKSTQFTPANQTHPILPTYQGQFMQ